MDDERISGYFQRGGGGVRSNVLNTQILRRFSGDVNSVSWGEWHDFEIICNPPLHLRTGMLRLATRIHMLHWS